MKFRTLTTLFALAFAAAAAADERPAPPEEVFRYAVFDAGDAFEIDWFVDDGAYMYESAFRFSVDDERIRLGAPKYPEAEIHSDDFLGEQAIHRGSFLIRIPYTADEGAPERVDLVLDSRGCLDSGFCYAPTRWTESVQLAGPSKAQFDAVLAPPANDDFPPADDVFFPDVFVADGRSLELGLRIADGFYVYREKITLEVTSGPARAVSLALPKGKSKTDDFFGEQEVYYGDILGTAALARGTTNAETITVSFGYQGCAEGGLCYLPQKKTFTVGLPAVSSIDDLSSFAAGAVSGASGGDPGGVAAGPAAPVSEQGRLAAIITGSSLWAVIAVFFFSGLALAFTPCVLPMIPILSGIIAGEGDNVSTSKGFLLSLTYVMGMALVYTAAGIAAAAAGLQLQAAFNAPWVLVLFSGLFVLLALSMFGLFELQMPSSLQSRLATVSGNQQGGTFVGAFIMGALSSLIVTACVAPPLVAALTVIGQTGDMLRGGSALFAMSLGMGAPLLLVGASAGQLLPRAGVWMEKVKGAFGFMMLGLAVWMLSRFLPGEITLVLWAVLVFMAGVFLGGLTSLGPEAPVGQKLGKGFGSLGLIYGVLLFVGALTGGSNPLQPLNSINLGGAAVVDAETHLEFERIKTVDDLNRAVADASARGKSVMLDFYADWCVSCKEMEAFTFTDSAVQATLSNTLLLQADVTANDEADQALLARFGVYGPPTIVFFGEDGRERLGYEVVGFMNADNFAEHVRQAFAATATTASQQD